MTLDDRGEVSDARVLSGPEELRKATLEAVLQWHYSPAAIRSTVTQATLRFRVPSDLKTVEVFEEPVLVDESVATARRNGRSINRLIPRNLWWRSRRRSTIRP